MNRLALAVGVVLVVGTVPVTVAGANLNASVSGVEVSPALPAPGETITITPTIRNLAGSDDSMLINAVAIRRAKSGGVTEYARVEELGTLSPGSEVSVPLTVRFDSPGTRQLRVMVFGQVAGNPTETIRLRYPVTVSVRDRHPQLDIRTNESVDDVESNGTVTIANGLDTPLSNVELTVDGTGVTMIDNRAVFASIAAGDTQAAPFSYRPQTPGPHSLTATLSYTIADDARRTVTHSTVFETEPLREQVVIDATSIGAGDTSALSVDIVNQGNTAIENVVVTAESDNGTFRRVILDRVGPGSSRSVRLNATLDEPRANVTVTAAYDVATTTNTVSTTADFRFTPGAITLSGLDVIRDEGLVQITGTTANVGLTDVESVLVRVVRTDAVEPAFPNKEYFVGTVPASDFVSFDVYARPSANATTVPLEVTYLVDGDRKRQTFDVDISDVPDDSQQQPDGPLSGLGGLLPAVGIGLVAVLVVLVVLVRRYRRRDDETEL